MFNSTNAPEAPVEQKCPESTTSAPVASGANILEEYSADISPGDNERSVKTKVLGELMTALVGTREFLDECIVDWDTNERPCTIFLANIWAAYHDKAKEKPREWCYGARAGNVFADWQNIKQAAATAQADGKSFHLLDDDEFDIKERMVRRISKWADKAEKNDNARLEEAIKSGDQAAIDVARARCKTADEYYKIYKATYGLGKKNTK